MRSDHYRFLFCLGRTSSLLSAEQKLREKLKIVGQVRDCIDRVAKLTKAGASSINAFENLRDRIENARSPRDVAGIINASQDFRRALENLGVQTTSGQVILDESDKVADSTKVLSDAIDAARSAIKR